MRAEDGEKPVCGSRFRKRKLKQTAKSMVCGQEKFVAAWQLYICNTTEQNRAVCNETVKIQMAEE